LDALPATRSVTNAEAKEYFDAEIAMTESCPAPPVGGKARVNPNAPSANDEEGMPVTAANLARTGRGNTRLNGCLKKTSSTKPCCG